MKRRGRRLQPTEGDGVVYDDITEAGPPASDAHLYRSSRLNQIQINAGSVTLAHAVYLTDSSGLIKHSQLETHEQWLVPAQGKPQ